MKPTLKRRLTNKGQVFLGKSLFRGNGEYIEIEPIGLQRFRLREYSVDKKPWKNSEVVRVDSRRRLTIPKYMRFRGHVFGGEIMEVKLNLDNSIEIMVNQNSDELEKENGIGDERTV